MKHVNINLDGNPHQKKILHYFQEGKFSDLNEFSKNWSHLPHCRAFRLRDYLIILSSCAHTLATAPQKQSHQEIADHISKNFDKWFTPSQDSYRHRSSLVDAIRPLTILQSHFPNIDFRQTYKKIRLTDRMRQSQSLEALHGDLLFLGKSPIKAGENRSKPNGSERNLGRLIEVAGFNVSFPRKPFIRGLKQAVDLITHGKNGGQAGIEYDGPNHFENEVRIEAHDVKKLIEIATMQDLVRRAESLVLTPKTITRAVTSVRAAPEARILHVSFAVANILEKHILENPEGTDHLDFMRERMNAAFNSPPGNYNMVTDDRLITSILPAANTAELNSIFRATWTQAARRRQGERDSEALLDRHGHPHSRSSGSHPAPAASGQ